MTGRARPSTDWIPAKAGIYLTAAQAHEPWVPASAATYPRVRGA
jgi:hypothetical protein